MSQSLRQSELFASQEWEVLYQAFTQVNFNASDPASIASAMRDYIVANYPEDFNDWIESSEFVAYIDLLSYLAGTLAFKTDINARENFMEVSEARESILRLARFLSYNPRRCQSARGLVKLTAIQTDDDVYDSNGVNLSGTTIQWDNPDDGDWYERFCAVLNSAMPQTSPFGASLYSGTVSGVSTQLYRINASMGENNLSFSSRIGGSAASTSFELCNGNFTDGESFFERAPNRESPIHFFYRNDSAGNGSSRTGFFFMFKQGRTTQSNFAISTPQANRLLDIETTNINDSDVWVQTVNDSGQVLEDWVKVPAIFSENITFNSLSPTERNIFSVVTRDNDRVSIRFADGIFGTAPVGNIRVTHRAANGEQYQIRPSDMSRVTVTLAYYNRRGLKRNLTLTLSLQEPVSNAARAETEAQIKRRAASVFGTQNRMVTGEDYNVYPLTSNLIRKLKAVSRIYSGHSRFIDLNDPTGTYQHTNVFADDGIIYQEPFNRYTEVPLQFNRTPEEMLLLHIQPLIESDEVRGYANDVLTNRAIADGNPEVPVGCTWHNVTSATASSTGYFSIANSYFTVGATLLFSYMAEGVTVQEWATIGSITNTATSAPVTGQRYGSVSINQAIPDGATIVKIVPVYMSALDSSATEEAKTRLEERLSFSLWFNPETGTWRVRDAETLATDMNAINYLPEIKLASVEYSGSGYWRISARGQRLVFESERSVKWFHPGSRAIDPETGARQNDLIRIIRINGRLDDSAPLGVDYDLYLQKLIQYGDGYAEAARIQAGLADSDEDGQADVPDAFLKVISTLPRLNTLFWRREASSDNLTGFSPYNGVRVYQHEAERLADNGAKSAVDGDIIAYQIEASDPAEDRTFWLWNGSDWQRETQRFKAATGRGSNMCQFWVNGASKVTTSADERRAARLNFQWKHYAPSDHRIDPSPTNVMDMFVLTEEYDYAIRQWVANGAIAADLPTPPSELDLRLTFVEYDKSKMQSDTMVWRPVRYKLLFGPGADATLRAQFKLVRLPNSTLSDGEIKSRVVQAINDYFALDAWDFGSRFYYSELNALIHNRLVGSIASCEIVPMFEDASFGNLHEIQCRSDELFISTAQVADIQIIGANTPSNLRMR